MMVLDLNVVGAWSAVVVAIGAAVAVLQKLLTRDLKRDIGDANRKIDELSHKVKNLSQKVDALHGFRTADVERIIRLETNMTHIAASLDRIEEKLDRHDA